MLWMGESLRSALMAVSVMVVEQLGFAMMPWCSFTSPGLISGTTSGTFGSRRKAEELSTNTAPERTIAGAKRSAMSFSAAPRTMSMPAKAASVASSTTMSCPCHDTTLPAERALGEQVQLPDGEAALGEDLHHFLTHGAACAEDGNTILLHI